VFSKFDRNINQNRTTVKEKYLEELEILEMSDDQEIQSSDNEENLGESGGNDGQEDFRSGKISLGLPAIMARPIK